MKTIKDNNKQLANTHAYSYKDKLLISKKKKYLRAVTKKDSIKKKEISEKINYNDLKFIDYSSSLETHFSRLKDPVTFLGDIQIKY